MRPRRSPDERSDIRERRCSAYLAPDVAALIRATKEEIKKETERRETRSHEPRHRDERHRPPRLRARRRPTGRLASRRSVAALAGRLSPSGSAPGQASWDVAGAPDLMDRQPGRRSCAVSRALSAPACPSPEGTPRTGRSTGAHDARSRPGAGGKPARRRRTRSNRPACRPGGVLSSEEFDPPLMTVRGACQMIRSRAGGC